MNVALRRELDRALHPMPHPREALVYPLGQAKRRVLSPAWHADLEAQLATYITEATTHGTPLDKAFETAAKIRARAISTQLTAPSTATRR